MGDNNQLPWPEFPQEGEWFTQNTDNKIAIVGSESYIAHGRIRNCTNIVLSTNKNKINLEEDDQVYSGDIKDILKELLHKYSDKDIIVVGGLTTIQEVLPYCHNIYISRISIDVNGDTVLPREVFSYITLTYNLSDYKKLDTAPQLEFLKYSRSVH